MSTKTAIANLAMVRIGEAIFTDVDSDGTTPADEINAIWDLVVQDTIDIGPEKGWKFAQWDISDVDVDNTAITAFADYSGTVSGTTLVTSASHGLLTGDLVNITDTTSYDDTYTITKVSGDTFYVTVDFVADDATGTVQWTSEKFFYRFARPTSTRVTGIFVGGSPITDWVRKRGWILTSVEDTEVAMDYVLALADLTVAEFPSHFIQVLWRKLAIHVLYARSQNQRLQDRLTEEIEEVYLPRAMGADAKEQYVQEESSAWQDAGHTVTLIE